MTLWVESLENEEIDKNQKQDRYATVFNRDTSSYVLDENDTSFNWER